MDLTYRTPAQMIEDRLQERGWTQRVLAKVLGLTETKVSNIMNCRTSISTELALQLSTVLGVDADQLLKIQTSYELAKAQLEFRPDPDMAIRANVFSGLPVSDMVKRGWLNGVSDIKDANLEPALCKFFNAQSINEIEIMPHAAKKTDVAGNATLSQLAWLYRVRQIAEDMLVAKYSEDGLHVAVERLHALLVSADAARKVARIMTECGIRLVFVEALPSTKIDGVCFWLDDRSPVIGMTLRFDRIDNFWFVLRHEIEHVLRGDGKNAILLDTDMETERSTHGATIPEEEMHADLAAAEFCVPQNSLQKFIVKKAPFFAERDILGFSKTLGVHPGLVAGQLQRKTGRYDLFRNHLVKIRSIVIPGNTVDGWGDVAPVGA